MSETIVPVLTAKCKKCNIEQPTSEFYICSGKLKPMCKKCFSKRNYERTEGLIERRRPSPEPGKHWCFTCDVQKDISAFPPCEINPPKGRARKESGRCRECRSKYQYAESTRSMKRHGVNHQSARAARTQPTTDPIELAYVAGLIDAEGCSHSIKAKTRHPLMDVASDNACLLEFVQSKIGGTIVFASKSNSDGTKGVVEIKRIAEILVACNAVIPFLKIKKEQFEILRDICLVPVCERRALKERLDILNTKGVTENRDLPETWYPTALCISEAMDIDFAYMAGLIDGDGHIAFGWNRPEIEVSMTRTASIYYLQSLFGGTICYKEMKLENHAMAYRWVPLMNTDVWKLFLSRLMKFLILKKEHAKLAIDAIDKTPEERQEITDKMQALTALNRSEQFTRSKSRTAPDEDHVSIKINEFNKKRFEELHAVAYREWVGMPEFVQEKIEPYKKLTVRFSCQEDVDDFIKRIGQGITSRTKSIWHPITSRVSGKRGRYVDESAVPNLHRVEGSLGNETDF